MHFCVCKNHYKRSVLPQGLPSSLPATMAVFLNALLVVMSLLHVTSAHVDRSMQMAATGADVVEAVTSKMKTSCLFGQEVVLAKRYAHWAMQARKGESEGGGVWKVSHHLFTEKLEKSLFPLVQRAFNVDFGKMRWEELSIPLYSGLSFLLYMRYLSKLHNFAIPQGVYQQGEFLQTFYQRDLVPSMFQRVVEESEQVTCKAADTDVLIVAAWEDGLSEADFLAIKESLKSFMNSALSEFALIQVSTHIKHVFNFSTDPTSRSNAVEKLDRAPPPGQLDLRAISSQAFNSDTGARNNASKVVLLLLGGGSGKDSKAEFEGGWKEKVEDFKRRERNQYEGLQRNHYKDVTIVAVDLGGEEDLAQLLSSSGSNDEDCWNCMSVSGQDLKHNLHYLQEKVCKAPHFIDVNTSHLPVTRGEPTYCKIELNSLETHITVRVENAPTPFHGTIYFSELPYLNKDLYDLAKPLFGGATTTATFSRPPSGSSFVYCFVEVNFGTSALLEVKILPKDEVTVEANVTHKASTTASSYRPTGSSEEGDYDSGTHYYSEYYGGDNATGHHVSTTNIPPYYQPTTSLTQNFSKSGNLNVTFNHTVNTWNPPFNNNNTSTKSTTTTTYQASNPSSNPSVDDMDTTIFADLTTISFNGPARGHENITTVRYERPTTDALDRTGSDKWTTNGNPLLTAITEAPTQATTEPDFTYNCREKNPCRRRGRKARFYFAHDDASMFVQCSEWGRCYERLCPDGLEWIREVGACD